MKTAIAICLLIVVLAIVVLIAWDNPLPFAELAELNAMPLERGHEDSNFTNPVATNEDDLKNAGKLLTGSALVAAISLVWRVGLAIYHIKHPKTVRVILETNPD